MVYAYVQNSPFHLPTLQLKNVLHE